jgi:hypothetical protein
MEAPEAPPSSDHPGTSGPPRAGPGAMTNDPLMPVGVPPRPAELPENPFAAGCREPVTAAVTPVRRMSKREYRNTVLDLFAGQVDAAALESGLARFEESLLGPLDNVKRDITRDYVEATFQIATEVGRRLSMPAARTALLQRFCAKGQRPDDCLAAFVTSFGLRALRRPPTAEEKATFTRIYQEGEAALEGEGIRRLLVAVLVSPAFLYRHELGETPVSGRPGLLKLSAYELASRLSYAIWQTMPDEALLRASESGEILTESGYRAQVDRLFQDPRAKATARDFYGQWLGLDHVNLPPLPEGTTGINPEELRSQSLLEIERFMEDAIWKDGGSYRDLMTSTQLPVTTGSLARVYGSGQERAGLLTRAALLMSFNDQTNLVHRGVTVASRFLCEEIPKPDPDSLPPDALSPPPLNPDMTTRQRFDAKTAGPICQACHRRLNALGYVLENYDGLGRYRRNEPILDESGKLIRTLPIDAKVELVVDDVPVSADGAMGLGRVLAESRRGPACLAETWFKFAHGRTAMEEDACQLGALYDGLRAAGGSILAMMKATVLQPSFRLRQVAGECR